MRCGRAMNKYRGKKVLITGHTGFKGSWLSAWLTSLGADVVGLSNEIPSAPSNFEASDIGSLIEDHRIDIRDQEAVDKLVQACQPDFVFHLAAQALVRPSYEFPLETIATNAMGTAHILDALCRLDKPVVAVMITSDKAYDNVEWAWGYRETDRLGGKDPYSASKGMAELVIRTYAESYFNTPESNVRVGIARAGNVIGGGDWAKDRIVPDCMNAWSRSEVVDIRSPDATRPWQHVLEPLSGYLVLGSELSANGRLQGEAYNMGPPGNQNHSVRELIEMMANYWGNVRWNEVSKRQQNFHEAGLLKLNCDKALFDFGWLSTLYFRDTVRMTVEWYSAYYQGNGASMQGYTITQIDEYMNIAKKRGIAWAME